MNMHRSSGLNDLSFDPVLNLQPLTSGQEDKQLYVKHTKHP